MRWPSRTAPQEQVGDEEAQCRSAKAKEAWASLSDSVKRQLMRETVADWARTTSMHGISKLAEEGSTQRVALRRVLWSLLLLCSLTVLLYQTVLLVAKYAENPTSISSQELDKKELQFPAVTVCPLNSLSNSRLMALKKELEPIVGYIFQQGGASANSSLGNVNQTCEEKWEKAVANVPSPDAYVHQSVSMSASRLNDSLLQRLSVSLQQLLLDCSFYGRQCTPADFVTFRSDTFGLCYTFNFHGRRRVRRSGPMSCLLMTLALNQSDYLPNGCGDAGFRILVHQPGRYPFAEARGHHLSPGFSTQIGLAFHQIDKLPPPYGTCRRYSEAENRRLNWYVDSAIGSNATAAYSHKACTKTCLQRRFLKLCGCYYSGSTIPGRMRGLAQPCDLRPDAGPTNRTVCPSRQLVLSISSSCALRCKFSCSKRVYRTSLSFAQFPSISYLPRLVQLATASGHGSDVAEAKRQRRLLNYARNNFLRVSVFAESLKLQATRQFASYQLKDLLSDCGGQAGFWLGLSVLTVCELLELITTLLRGACAKE